MAEAEGGDADDERAGRRPWPWRPASRRRRAGPGPPVAGVVGAGEERRGVGADRDEPGHAHVEEAGHAPLEVEAEADQGVVERQHEEEGQVAGDVEHQGRSPGRPVGRTSSTARRYQEGDSGPVLGADERDRERLGEADDEAAQHRPVDAAHAAQDRGREEGEQEVEAEQGADLDGQSHEDAGDGGQRAADEPGPPRHDLRDRSRSPRAARVSLAARMARPMVVRVRSRWSAATRTAASARPTTWSAVTRTPGRTGWAIWIRA